MVQPAVSRQPRGSIPFLSTRFVAQGGAVRLRRRHRRPRLPSRPLRGDGPGALRDGRAVFSCRCAASTGSACVSSSRRRAELGARSVEDQRQGRVAPPPVGSTGPRVRGVLTQLQTPAHPRARHRRDVHQRVATPSSPSRRPIACPGRTSWTTTTGASWTAPRRSSRATRAPRPPRGRQDAADPHGRRGRRGASASSPCLDGRHRQHPEGSFQHPAQATDVSATYDGSGALRPHHELLWATSRIHGYLPVPPYPASHGCVREPLWVARLGVRPLLRRRAALPLP